MSLTKDNEKPLSYTHFKGEGEVEFASILFVPGGMNHMLINNYYDK